MKKSLATTILCALAIALLATSCSFAEAVPEEYLSEEYIVAPAAEGALVIDPEDTTPPSYDRTMPEPTKPTTGIPPKRPKQTTGAGGGAAGGTGGTNNNNNNANNPPAEKADSEKYESVEYNEDGGVYDKKETLYNVKVTGQGVSLENKTIKGTLTLTDDSLVTFYMYKCVVEGEIRVLGDIEQMVLQDTTVEKLDIRSPFGTNLEIAGKCYVKETNIRTESVTLTATDVDDTYSGFNNITIAKNAKIDFTRVEINGAKCKNITNNQTSDIYLDEDAEVIAFNNTAPLDLYNAANVSKFYTSSNFVNLYGGAPDRITCSNKVDINEEDGLNCYEDNEGLIPITLTKK